MNAANCCTGVTTELNLSVVYTCTTSLPALSPVLVTVTVTLKSSEVLIVELDKVRSVL